jgi:hypothetical protein
VKNGLFLFIIILGIAISGCISNQHITQTIVDGDIPVGAGKYVYYQFSIPSQGSISGNFTALGGGGNDINILILDETSYVNWINGHNVSTYYNSGQMTTGSITTTLPAGKYYLIYSNTFSTFSDKKVKTKVDVSY